MGLRADKPAPEIIEEKPSPKSPAKKVSVTHPDKIIYPREKITKQQVADYYAAVRPWIVPHIENRPLSFVRCPQGATEKCFYSKHLTEKLPAGLKAIPQKSGEAPWITLDSKQGLLSLVQRGTLEFHPWGCHQPDIEAPDQIVMDFDPDPSVDFETVKEAAWELKKILEQLDLKVFLKTTGGKGLHVQFPFEPRYTWEQVKSFSKTLVAELVSRRPKLYTANVSKVARKGKIFVDYLRNGRGATAVAPYSFKGEAAKRGRDADPLG